MDRRAFLRTVGLVTSGGVAGCLGLETRSATVPPVVENRPDAVYYPSHVEGMKMVGRAEQGDYAFALMYSFPHRFWTVTGTDVSKTSIQENDSMHLMATVWDPDSRTVLPETGLSIELQRDGELVSEEVIYPMLSQPMGFHYGGNFGVPGDGTYTARVSVGAMGIRRTGGFREKFGEPANVDIEFGYSEKEKNEIAFETLDEKAGKPGAVEVMGMDIPNSVAPAKADLPGRVVGEATSGDGVFVVTLLDSPPTGVEGDGPYLAVSARTPYNRMILPMMGLTAAIDRDGETVFEGSLERTLDPSLDYHYGAVVDRVASGDVLTLSVSPPPQVARHEGYETAFVEMADMELTA